MSRFSIAAGLPVAFRLGEVAIMAASHIENALAEALSGSNVIAGDDASR
jgi:hypothetical protein